MSKSLLCLCVLIGIFSANVCGSVCSDDDHCELNGLYQMHSWHLNNKKNIMNLHWMPFQLNRKRRTTKMWPKIVWRPRYLHWLNITSKRIRLVCLEHQYPIHLLCPMCRNQLEWVHWRWKIHRHTDCPSFVSRVFPWMSMSWRWLLFEVPLPVLYYAFMYFSGKYRNSIGCDVGKR